MSTKKTTTMNITQEEWLKIEEWIQLFPYPNTTVGPTAFRSGILNEDKSKFRRLRLTLETSNWEDLSKTE